MYNFGDVPDNFVTKKHLVFNRTFWKCIKMLGWEQILKDFEIGAKAFTYDTFKYRLDDAIK
ncbi:MAG: hypothetical protein ACFFCM_14775, partial [Promethearchaeota archaeon]